MHDSAYVARFVRLQSDGLEYNVEGQTKPSGLPIVLRDVTKHAIGTPITQHSGEKRANQANTLVLQQNLQNVINPSQ